MRNSAFRLLVSILITWSPTSSADCNLIIPLLFHPFDSNHSKIIASLRSQRRYMLLSYQGLNPQSSPVKTRYPITYLTTALGSCSTLLQFRRFSLQEPSNIVMQPLRHGCKLLLCCHLWKNGLIPLLYQHLRPYKGGWQLGSGINVVWKIGNATSYVFTFQIPSSVQSSVRSQCLIFRLYENPPVFKQCQIHV